MQESHVSFFEKLPGCCVEVGFGSGRRRGWETRAAAAGQRQWRGGAWLEPGVPCRRARPRRLAHTLEADVGGANRG